MSENEKLRKGAKIRLIGLVCGLLGIILLLVAIFTGSNILIIPMMVLWAIALILMAYDFLFVDSDYYTYDFGIFTTKIHKAFSEKFVEATPESELSEFDCKIKKFENSCDNGEHKYDFGSGWQGTTRYEKYEMIPTKCFFEITYMEFNTEEEHVSNEKKIKEHFKTNHFTAVSTKHFSSKNIHIVFQCYTMGYSTYRSERVIFSQAGVYMDLKEVSPHGLIGKASKNVVLK